jgi:hypothetical protein
VGDETDGAAGGAGLLGLDTSGELRNDAGQPANCRVVSTIAAIPRKGPDLTRFVAREQAKVVRVIS